MHAAAKADGLSEAEMKAKFYDITGEYFDDFYEAVQDKQTYNVAFGEDGIDVVFGEYEIAPYAAGLITIPVSWKELEPILRK